MNTHARRPWLRFVAQEDGHFAQKAFPTASPLQYRGFTSFIFGVVARLVSVGGRQMVGLEGKGDALQTQSIAASKTAARSVSNPQHY